MHLIRVSDDVGQKDVRFIWRDVHGFKVATVEASAHGVPAGTYVDPALGTLAGTPNSLANVTADGDLQIFVQLADEYGSAVRDGESYAKVLLSARVPGIVDDDDTPLRELAVPEEEEGEGG